MLRQCAKNPFYNKITCKLWASSARPTCNLLHIRFWINFWSLCIQWTFTVAIFMTSVIYGVTTHSLRGYNLGFSLAPDCWWVSKEMVDKASVLRLFTVTVEVWPDFMATVLPRASLPFYSLPWRFLRAGTWAFIGMGTLLETLLMFNKCHSEALMSLSNWKCAHAVIRQNPPGHIFNSWPYSGDSC